MSNVFLRFRQPILAWNTPLAELHPKRVMIQSCQPRSLGEGEPPPRVKAASQFDLHVPFALARPEGEIGQGLLVEFKRDAHAESLALFKGGVNLSSARMSHCGGA